MLIITIIVVWFFIGMYGHYYNWTKKYDVNTEDFLLMILCGFAGPISALVCWLVMKENQTIFKKRK